MEGGGKVVHTQVGIVGAGPAGLLLAHLLERAGVGSVAIDTRTRQAIEGTVRAGVLEQGTADLLRDLGLGGRMDREGAVHHGIEIRFAGARHRIDFTALADGRGVTVYAQHEVLKDLIAARLAAGGALHFGVAGTTVAGADGTSPTIAFTDADGVARVLVCDFVAGCDGFHGVCRAAIPTLRRVEYHALHGFGWFGILCAAPPSSEELIYAHHDRGFALVSTRSPDVQRLYFQCRPDEDALAWSDQEIWDELVARTAVPGFVLKQGRIFQKNVVRPRSFVCETMRHGRLFLAGDSAHTVPPTGAKGLNLAANDVVLLARALEQFYRTGEEAGLSGYAAAALGRVWRAQHFSSWMTGLLHRLPGMSGFDLRRQRAELDLVASSPEAAGLLARLYVGEPLGG